MGTVLTDFRFLSAKCMRVSDGRLGLIVDFALGLSNWPDAGTRDPPLLRNVVSAFAAVFRLHHSEWADDGGRLPQQMYPWLYWWNEPVSAGDTVWSDSRQSAAHNSDRWTTDGCDVAVIDRTSGAQLLSWRTGSVPVRGLAWTPDGRGLVTCALDGRVCLWRYPSTALETELLAAHDDGGLWEDPEYRWPGDDWPTGPSFSTDGRLLAVGRGDQCYLWRLPDASPVASLRDPREDKTLAGTNYRGSNVIGWARLRPDGHALAVGMWDGAIRVWSTATREPGVLLLGPSRMVTDLAWSPTRPSQLAAAYAFGDSLLWDLEPQPRQSRLAQCQSTTISVAFSRDGHHVLATEEAGVSGST